VPQYLALLWNEPYIRLPFYLALLWLAWILLGRMSNVVAVIGMAYGLSYLVNPLLSWLEKRGLGRPWGTLLLVLLFLGVMGVLFWTLASQISAFISGLPVLLNRLPSLLEKAFKDHSEVPGIAQMQTRLTEYVRNQVGEINSNVGPILAGALNPNSDIFSRVGSFLGWLGQGVIVLTLGVFFMLDHTRPGRMLLGLLPRHWQPTAKRLSDDVSRSFGTYLRGQLLTSLATAVVAALGLLVLNVPNALALGLLTGLLNLVPAVGMVLAAVPVILQALPQGTTTILLVCGLYFILNQLAWNVIAPTIMGRTSTLKPAGILVAVLTGATLAGFLGAFLAIPAALLLQLWVSRYWLGSPAQRGAPPAPTEPDHFWPADEPPDDSPVTAGKGDQDSPQSPGAAAPGKQDHPAHPATAQTDHGAPSQNSQNG
jgi:predicted PurR-regulated permease PerM